MLNVPVLQRHVAVDSGDPPLPSLALFGHPTIIQIPSDITGSALYECIEAVAPVDGAFEILLTEAYGLTCSRCSVACAGCSVERDETELKLQPRDCITLKYFSNASLMLNIVVF